MTNTLDQQLLDSAYGRRKVTNTLDQQLLDSTYGDDWQHKDPWRVLRIQAEFVSGFDTLAELGPAVCLQRAVKR